MASGDNKKSTAVTVNYGSSVVVLPGAAAEKLPLASKEEITVLLAVLGQKETTVDGIAKICDIDDEDVRAALAFWRGAGVIDIGKPSENSDVDKAENDKIKKADKEKTGKDASAAGKGKRPSSELPEYKMEEISQIVEDNADLGKMIDDCERILGRMFRVSETSHLLALVDQLGLSPEYVLLLCTFCARQGKTTLRYVETTAVRLHDDGIVTVEELESYLRQIERMDELLPELRDLFEIGDRQLTTRENGYFRSWILKYNYGIDVIRRAYEVAVDAKGAANPCYVNGIIENWYSEGLVTYDDVERKLNTDRAAKINAAGQSFDVDDFFAAALRRSYKDSDFTPDLARSNSFDTAKDKKKRSK